MQLVNDSKALWANGDAYFSRLLIVYTIWVYTYETICNLSKLLSFWRLPQFVFNTNYGCGCFLPTHFFYEVSVKFWNFLTILSIPSSSGLLSLQTYRINGNYCRVCVKICKHFCLLFAYPIHISFCFVYFIHFPFYPSLVFHWKMCKMRKPYHTHTERFEKSNNSNNGITSKFV